MLTRSGPLAVATVLLLGVCEPPAPSPEIPVPEAVRETEGVAAPAPPASPAEEKQREQHRHRHHRSRRRPRCPNGQLRGVYHPYRLDVLEPCMWVRGTVADVRPEEDGDHHVNVRPVRSDKRLLARANRTVQHGALVTEIMPGQHLPVPSIGERVAVFGTWVRDTEHGWNEIHPMWAIRYFDRGYTRRALPPRNPRYKPSGGVVGGGGGGGNNDAAKGCDPSYPTVCIPRYPPDLDCSDVNKRNFKVKGSDPHGFDGDNDGVGCET